MPTSGYRLIEAPVPKQRLVHIHADANELGRVYRPELAINAAPDPAAEALAALTPPRRIPWGRWRRQARADYLAHIAPQETPGAVKLEQVVAHLREILPCDAIVTNGAGNYAAWVNRYYQYAPYPTQLAPTSGSMGYGLPAACAAKLLHPEREVVAFAGDGCLMMTVQELATAVQYELPLILIVCNNGMYGTIRMHQELAYPGRVSATELVNPDFASMAASFGAHGEAVEAGGEFPDAFARARECGRPALIELRLDQEALSPRLRLSEMRRK